MNKLIVCVVLSTLISACSSPEEYISNAKGDYLGEETPKNSAIVFAEGIISLSDRYEYGLAISPNHDEIYFTAENPADTLQLTGLIRIKREGNRWLLPQKANLNQQGFWEQEAFFTTNGSKLYYAVAKDNKVNLWFSEREGDGWSKGQELNSMVNDSSQIVFYATFSKNGNMYYTDVIKRKIFMSPINDGSYNEIIDPGIEKGGHSFISPDESFMLIDASGDNSMGKRDIFVVFKNNDGSWGEAINLGSKVNTEFSETCPSLSPDGKFIFFGRYNDLNNKSNIYWISAEILNQLKP